MYRFDTTGQLTMLDLDTAERGRGSAQAQTGQTGLRTGFDPVFPLGSGIRFCRPLRAAPLGYPISMAQR